MKRIIYITAALALAACSNDELIDSGTTTPADIKIDVVADNVSRTEQIHTPSVKPETFLIWAIDDDETLIDENNATTKHSQDNIAFHFAGETVVRGETNSGGISYHFQSGPKYWPADVHDKLYVAAFHKYDNSTSSEVDLQPEFTCSFEYNDDADETKATAIEDIILKFKDTEIPPTWADQHDILYAVNYGVTRDSNNEHIALTFKHALALLQFQFSNASNTLYVEINGLTLGTTDSPIVNKRHVEYDLKMSTSVVETDPWSSYNNVNTIGTGTEYWAGGTSYFSVPNESSVDESKAKKLFVIPQTSTSIDSSKGLPLSSKTYFTPLTLSCRIYNIINPDEFNAAVAALGDNPTAEQIHNLLTIGSADGSTVPSTDTDSSATDTNTDTDSSATDSGTTDGSSTDSGTTDTTTSKVIKPYGVPIYVNGDGGFRDLKVNIPTVMQRDGEVSKEVGWKAGYKYTYTISFGGINHDAVDDSGNQLFVPIQFLKVEVDPAYETVEKTYNYDN
jgi:hypothetical protein